jgi:hypothetical protein
VWGNGGRLSDLSMSLRHVSPGHRLAGVGLLATLTFAGVDWNRAQARGTPRMLRTRPTKAPPTKRSRAASTGCRTVPTIK